jgi:hypothetical protein
MTYYANVDDAAMQAILGRKRNSSRNSEAGGARDNAAEQAANNREDEVCD